MTLRSARRRTGGSAVWLGTLALAVGLSGCDAVVNPPIEVYRSLAGVNKNDPDPATAPFNANIEKAQGGDYANLASVPPPPTIVTTVAERQKLTENLSGERTSAQAKDASGSLGAPASGPVPPPPPIPPELAAPEMAALPPTPKPETPVPPMRKMDEPPVPLPPETTMQPPRIGNVPGVEPPRPPAAQGHPSGMPQPAPSSLPAATVKSGNPQPAPPPTTLPEAKPEPAAAAMPPPKLPPVGMTVASLDVPPGAAAIGSDERSRLAQVIAQYKEKPRMVRVVAFAAPGVGSAEQLNAFRTALDRAQVVAKELSDAGIPANKIQTEASPSTAAAPTGRVEVQLLQ